MPRKMVIGTTSNTASSTMQVYNPHPVSVSVHIVGKKKAPSATKQKLDKKIEDAVYSHIQALRTLGHEVANTAEIARSLHLPVNTVDGVVAKLMSKGVKVAR